MGRGAADLPMMLTMRGSWAPPVIVSALLVLALLGHLRAHAHVELLDLGQDSVDGALPAGPMADPDEKEGDHAPPHDPAKTSQACTVTLQGKPQGESPASRALADVVAVVWASPGTNRIPGKPSPADCPFPNRTPVDDGVLLRT